MATSAANSTRQAHLLLRDAYQLTFSLRQAASPEALRTIFSLQSLLIAASESLTQQERSSQFAGQVSAHLHTMTAANDEAENV